jgi:hypothetical protein
MRWGQISSHLQPPLLLVVLTQPCVAVEDLQATCENKSTPAPGEGRCLSPWCRATRCPVMQELGPAALSDHVQMQQPSSAFAQHMRMEHRPGVCALLSTGGACLSLPAVRWCCHWGG